MENLRGLLPKPDPTQEAGEFVPQYIDLPPRRKTAATKNLQIGAVLLGVALNLGLCGNYLAGSRALLPLVSCLAAFTLLWVLARVRLFRQGNGVFLAIGMICLLGTTIALLEIGYRSMTGRSDTARLLAESSTPTATPADPGTSSPKSESEPPLLTKEMNIQPPPLDERVVKVLKDSKVTVGRKSYLLATGERFILDEVKDGLVIFKANELLLSLPADAVEIIGAEAAPVASAPEDETPAQVTHRAQQQAIRRYPALGVKDSPQNELFLQTYRDLRISGNDALKDPEWPLHVADSLAKREGWEASE